MQGSAHGFVDLQTQDGKRIAVGDLVQRAHGNIVTSRLTLHFFDGSLDDETTEYSQRGVFHFLKDHHVQHGPSFPTPTDVTVDAVRNLVAATDADGQAKQSPIKMPADVYNGMASTMLMNLSAATREIRISTVIAAPKPRIIHLAMSRSGEVPFTLGGLARSAVDFRVHVELGGVAGAVAPIIGKAPADYHVLIFGGDDPAFIREEGPLYEGGPIWRLQQISAAFPGGP